MVEPGPQYSLSATKGAWLCFLALFFPPMAVVAVDGCNYHVGVNFLLSLLGWIPGMVHAYIRICKHVALGGRSEALMLNKLELGELGTFDVDARTVRIPVVRQPAPQSSPVAPRSSPAQAQAQVQTAVPASPSRGGTHVRQHSIHRVPPPAVRDVDHAQSYAHGGGNGHLDDKKRGYDNGQLYGDFGAAAGGSSSAPPYEAQSGRA